MNVNDILSTMTEEQIKDYKNNNKRNYNIIIAILVY